MYIGKLNDRLTDLAFCSRILGTDTTPITVANGNPLFSEVFSVDWRYIFEKSVEIKISWSGKRNINDVVLHLGADCTPTEIRVRDANSGALLCKHTAETGENIDKRELTLPVEPHEARSLPFDSHSLSESHSSRLKFHDRPADGKYPHLLPDGNFEDPSALKDAVK